MLHALRRRLGVSEVKELLAAYRAGADCRELAHQFGVSKNGVLNLLHAEGLAIREPGLTTKQIEEAHDLRAGGMTFTAIAVQFGVHKSTVSRALQTGTSC
jgi:DNA-binding IclR family transcriptional regulator